MEFVEVSLVLAGLTHTHLPVSPLRRPPPNSHLAGFVAWVARLCRDPRGKGPRTQMFLSPRTVAYHLYKAFPKLGVTSRAELARLDLDDSRPSHHRKPIGAC